MKCDICEDKVTVCDDCGEKFHKGDILYCENGIHICPDCIGEEGEVI